MKFQHVSMLLCSIAASVQPSWGNLMTGLTFTIMPNKHVFKIGERFSVEYRWAAGFAPASDAPITLTPAGVIGPSETLNDAYDVSWFYATNGMGVGSLTCPSTPGYYDVKGFTTDAGGVQVGSSIRVFCTTNGMSQPWPVVGPPSATGTTTTASPGGGTSTGKLPVKVTDIVPSFVSISASSGCGQFVAPRAGEITAVALKWKSGGVQFCNIPLVCGPGRWGDGADKKRDLMSVYITQDVNGNDRLVFPENVLQQTKTKGLSKVDDVTYKLDGFNTMSSVIQFNGPSVVVEKDQTMCIQFGEVLQNSGVQDNSGKILVQVGLSYATTSSHSWAVGSDAHTHTLLGVGVGIFTVSMCIFMIVGCVILNRKITRDGYDDVH